MVTDKGSRFFDDLKKKESKHESDLSLLNQLYDGKGDKTHLHKIRRDLSPPMPHPLQFLYNKKLILMD